MSLAGRIRIRLEERHRRLVAMGSRAAFSTVASRHFGLLVIGVVASGLLPGPDLVAQARVPSVRLFLVVTLVLPIIQAGVLQPGCDALGRRFGVAETDYPARLALVVLPSIVPGFLIGISWGLAGILSSWSAALLYLAVVRHSSRRARGLSAAFHALHNFVVTAVILLSHPALAA